MFIGCGNLANPQPNDSDDEVNNILASIEAIAAQSFVDHRFILAVIMQEVGISLKRRLPLVDYMNCEKRT